MSQWGDAESLPDIEALSLDDLKRLVLHLLEEKAALGAEILGLREEIARLHANKAELLLVLERSSKPSLISATTFQMQ